VKSVSDCRKKFPPLTELPTPTAGNTGCCTFTATDVPSLFEAVEKANKEPGTVRVCVLPGEYELFDPLIIKRPQTTTGPYILTGCGQATQITNAKGPAVQVNGAEDVVIEKLALSGIPAVAVLAGTEGRAERVTIDSCHLSHPNSEWAIMAQGDALTVTANRCIGGVGIGPSSFGVRVERNAVLRGSYGVGIGAEATGLKPTDKNSDAMQVVVRENEFTNCRNGGVVVLVSSVLADNGELPVASELDVSDNRVTGCGITSAKNWPRAGILVARSAGVRIAGNTVRFCGQKKHAFGVFVAVVGGLEVIGNTVLDNGASEVTLSEYQGGIAVLGAVGGMVNTSGNQVPKRYEWFLTSSGLAAVRVTGNRVVCPLGPALLVSGVGPAVVSGNTLVTRGLGRWPENDPLKCGELADKLSQVARTAVAVVTLPEKDRKSLLAVLNPDSRLRFEGNQVTLFADSAKGRQYCVIRWPVDVSVTDNQFLARTPEGAGSVHLLVSVPPPLLDEEKSTARVVGNRVCEDPAERGFTSLLVETAPKQPPVVIALNQTTGTTLLSAAGGSTDLTAPTPRPFADGNQQVV
jgi:hypothetical protein